MIDFLIDKMQACADQPAVAVHGEVFTYAQLLDVTQRTREQLVASGVPAGSVVSFNGDYDCNSIAMFLALTEHRCVVVPLSADSAENHEEFKSIAMITHEIAIEDEQLKVTPIDGAQNHEFYATLRERQAPGLVLFSSGSTGKSKAAVHDLSLLLDKFRTERQQLRTLIFLQLDHIGGINTLLYTIANGGMTVVSDDRSPAAVCSAIAKHKVQLLPTSPTFLNLLLLSGEAKNHDMSSLTLITYGTEPMPQSTLEKVAAAFPNAKLQQTYGLSELGILRSKSKESTSLWVRVGGEGYETKIIDGRLWIKSKSAMLGYLNAPSPFDEDGFFDTGDRVEQDGEWLRILGRETEIINVGGSKVYPAEVESVLLTMDNVEDVAVYGEDHPITGKVVAVTVRLHESEPLRAFKTRMRIACKGRLEAYKIPAKVRVTDEPLHSERFKRMRRTAAQKGAAETV